VPLLVYVPGTDPGVYSGLTSAIDVMPTVLDVTGHEIPNWVEGTSLLSRVHDPSLPGREFTVTTVPFANPGDPVRSVDNIRRRLGHAPLTTVTTDEWSLVYSVGNDRSELYHLPSDPGQLDNLIGEKSDAAKDVHRSLVDFMRSTDLPDHLLKPRLELIV